MEKFVAIVRGLDEQNIKFSRKKVHLLEKAEIQFPTLQLTEEKTLKVVLHGIPELIPEKDVLEELLLQDFPVLKCKRLAFNGKPSPLVLIKLQRNAAGKSFADVTATKLTSEIREKGTTKPTATADSPAQTSNNDNVMAFACSLLANIAAAKDNADAMSIVLKSLPELLSILNGGK
ncbi:hypothetical protein CBL_21405 [Carabus blaptoides fortunei]